YPIRRISLSESGAEGTGTSDSPSVSADGRYVAFESTSLLVAGDTSTKDIFVVDRVNHTIEKVSLGMNGALANGDSDSPSISSDGRFVAFRSAAWNLVPGDTANVRGVSTGYSDIFVFDRVLRTTRLVSVSSTGGFANYGSGPVTDISADGRYIVFESTAYNLVDGDTGWVDIFVRDMQDNVTRRVSVGPGGIQSNGSSYQPVISNDGTVVAFESSATNLGVVDTNSVTDVYVYNLATGSMKRVSQASSGTEANNYSEAPAISGNGRYVGFYSTASNLVTGDTNGSTDIFVADLQNGTVEAASVSASGVLMGQVGTELSLSGDGRTVVFRSASTAATLSNVSEIFVRDLDAGSTRVVSKSMAGMAPDGYAYRSALSDDAKTVAFASDARNLVPGDSNNARDVFAVDVSSPWMANAQYVVVGASQAVDNIDFGNVLQQGHLSGTAWQDTSRDGVRDPNEPVLANRTIYIDSNANGSFDTGEPSTVTDALGNYHFVGLTAGTYVVREILPSKWSQTEPTSGSYAIASGVERNVVVDFEDLQNTSSSYITIGDYVHDGFVFSNSNAADSQWRVYGSQSTPQPPSAELVSDFRYSVQYLQRQDLGLFSVDSFDMRLRDLAGPRTVTLAGELPNGQWISQDISITGTATTYHLSGFDNLRSFRWFSTSSGVYVVDNFALRTTDWDYSSLDFGSMSNPGKISGTIYYDENKNGSRDGSDYPLGRQSVYLDLDNDAQLDPNEPRATSDSTGAYQFDVVNAGNYVLRQLVPVNWHQTQPADAYTIAMAPEEIQSGFDFGRWEDPTKIRGTKWNDLNANGLRDAGEPGLAGWTMYLDLNQNGVLDSGEPSTVTAADDPATSSVDESGTYGFGAITAGNYSVREVPRAGWRQTSPVAMTSQIERSSPTGFKYTGFTHTPTVAQAVSGDGRYLAFSTALALLPADTNSRTDIYWLDRQTDALELISVTDAQVPGNDTSFEPAISDDGRYVAFRSWASNLVANDTNQNDDIFVRDRATGTTQLVTIAGSNQANSYSYGETLTADGRTVLFWSAATNLVPNDINQQTDTFLKNLDTGAMTRVNTNTAPPDIGNENSYSGDITADGRYIAFQSFSNDIVPNDTNGYSDIFVFDRTSGLVQLASTSSTGTQGNGVSERRAISDDGRFVVFDSNATNLTGDAGVNGYNIYMKDLATGETRLISRNYNGGAANGSRR
ncbi:MAG: SdrD B-like domain-containing protein, partial [Aureliella sp.]